MRQNIFVFVIFQILLFASSEVRAQVVINEILASNTSTNLSEKSKNFVDWIEIYNDSDTRVSIGNWYLSDNKAKPTKWEIPFGRSLGSKEFKLFWFDKDDTSDYKNFMLNVDGETIYLFNQELVLVDSISYPLQIPDVSYGRLSGSLNELVYFQEPTPMKKNPVSGNKVLVFSGETIFSHKAGFYDTSFNLALSLPGDANKIYYTLDGSKPNLSSKVYTAPFEISNNTVVKAMAFSKDRLPGKVVTKSFFIKESVNLPVVSLTIDPEYLWDKEIGIYVDGANYIKDEWESANYFQDWERPVTVEYFEINSEAGFNINAGVRIHGRSSRTHAQKTLAIFAREKYGNQIVPYKLYGEKSPETIKSFLLRTGGNDWGITMFLDGFIHTLVNGKIDIDAQLYQPAIVYLNGEYWGIHNIREKINADYIKNKHQINLSKIDIIEANDIYADEMKASQGDMNDYNKMIEFIENNELSIKENYDQIKEWVDINEFINYMATQAYISNFDWPNSNQKFWKEKNVTGKWRWILYDTDLSFKEKGELEFNYIEHMLVDDSSKYVTVPWSNYLIRKLFESEELKNEFIQRIAVYLNTIFEPTHVLAVLDSIKRNIEPEITRNLIKWGGIRQNVVPLFETSMTQAEWEVNVEYYKEFAKSRPSVLRKSMIEYFDLDNPVNLKLSVDDEYAGRISLMGYMLEDGNFDGLVFPDIPIQMEAIPNKGYKFVKWKGGDYERNCIIDLKRNKTFTAIFEKIEEL